METGNAKENQVDGRRVDCDGGTGGGLIVMVVLAAAFKIASVVCLLWLVVATLRWLGVNI